jgi:hypothetical protein
MVIRMKTEEKSVMMVISITQMVVQMIVRIQDVETTSFKVLVKRSVMMEVIMTQLHQHAILTVRYEMYVEMVR